MMRGRIRSVAVIGAIAVGSTVLAGCGNGTTGAQSDGTSPSGAPTPTPSPTTTVPASGSPTTAVPATSTTTTAPRSQQPIMIVKAFNGTVSYAGTKPRTIDISGDSTNIVQDLTWRSWGPTTAVGRGTLGIDNCQPDCATGTVRHEPVTIGLGEVVHDHFTAMTEKADGVDRTFSYPSNWVTGAS